jgi:hypothetical protein
MDEVQTQDDVPPRAQKPAARSKVPLIAGASAGAAVIAALVVWGLTRGPADHPHPAPALVAAETPAPPPAPAAMPAPPAAGTVPTAVEPVPTEPPPAAEPKAEPPRPEGRLPRKVATATPAPPPPKPPPSKGIRSVREELNSIPTPAAQSGDGVLSVIATPWAEVWVDGAKIGETPREIRLGAGTYKLKATHPSLGTREKSITVQAGKRQVWNATFAN